MKNREDLQSCGCGGVTFPDPMMHEVLGQFLNSGKSPDAWSLATRGDAGVRVGRAGKI